MILSRSKSLVTSDFCIGLVVEEAIVVASVSLDADLDLDTGIEIGLSVFIDILDGLIDLGDGEGVM